MLHFRYSVNGQKEWNWILFGLLTLSTKNLLKPFLEVRFVAIVQTLKTCVSFPAPTNTIKPSTQIEIVPLTILVIENGKNFQLLLGLIDRKGAFSDVNTIFILHLISLGLDQNHLKFYGDTAHWKSNFMAPN